MLIDRYPPVDLFALVPRLAAQFEPELRELDRLLDDDLLVQRIRADLAQRHPHTLTHGRHSTPVEVVLRLLVVKQLYHWSYEQTEHFVADSLVLRQFCRVYLESVPDDTTLLRWANVIGPATVAQLNERVVELARSHKVTRGRKLRVDSTVVETAIHYPTDSRLLGDGVRVLSRLLHRAKDVVDDRAALGKDAFRSRTRTVRRLTQHLHRVARRQGAQAAEELQGAYRQLIEITHASCRQAERVRTALREPAKPAAKRVAEQLDHVLPLVEQAMTQATRRVLAGETVPANEKLLSLFESHTQVIKRHKAGKDVEFGRKLWLAEVEGGIVSGYRVLPEAGQDEAYLAESLAAHQRQFGRAPWLVTGDRGVSSPANEQLAQDAGVQRVVLPYKGHASPQRQQQEKQAWFRRGYRFRAGIEGRISVLRRGFGLGRCRNHGEAGLERWVGWGIVTANLAKIASTVSVRPTRRVARAA